MSHDHPVDPYQNPSAALHAMVRQFAVPPYNRLTLSNFQQSPTQYRWDLLLDTTAYLLVKTDEPTAIDQADPVPLAGTTNDYEAVAADGSSLYLFQRTVDNTNEVH